MYPERRDLYRQLEAKRNSRVIVYVTGDRSGLETKISSDALNFFIRHLDIIGDVDRITLYLYTRGGDTLAAWSIANLIRQFCKEFEVVVPEKARSGGTLICLSANKIVMTKQATLGPIDPSVDTPLNPQVPGAPPQTKVSVSVEALNSFLDFARKSLGDKADLANVFLMLSQSVHPLVLGGAYRARTQIRMLAKRLLSRQISDDNQIETILQFLCSESGSHDYTIDRAEAREGLGLQIEKPDNELYSLIKQIYDNIADELELTNPYDPGLLLGKNDRTVYSLKRVLLESTEGGSHVFISEGELNKIPFQQPGIPVPQEAIQDNRRFEGWRYNNVRPTN
jgi:hypothetical protein